MLIKRHETLWNTASLGSPKPFGKPAATGRLFPMLILRQLASNNVQFERYRLDEHASMAHPEQERRAGESLAVLSRRAARQAASYLASPPIGPRDTPPCTG